MTKVTIQEYSRYERERGNYRIYAFCLFLLGTRQVLEQVQEVEYILDTSFPDPVRRRRDLGDCFALQSEAWGSFVTNISIYWKNNKVDPVAHRVKLEGEAWPMGKQLVDFKSDDERQVYETLVSGRWQWRKLSTIARKPLISLDDAEAILKALASRKAARKAYFKSLEGEDLWGATSVVGFLPEPM